jgi:hypothetical protein
LLNLIPIFGLVTIKLARGYRRGIVPLSRFSLSMSLSSQNLAEHYQDGARSVGTPSSDCTDTVTDRWSTSDRMPLWSALWMTDTRNWGTQPTSKGFPAYPGSGSSIDPTVGYTGGASCLSLSLLSLYEVIFSKPCRTLSRWCQISRNSIIRLYGYGNGQVVNIRQNAFVVRSVDDRRSLLSGPTGVPGSYRTAPPHRTTVGH